MKAILPLLLMTILLGATPPASADDDPIAANFFSPELVMNHQADIGLKDEQRRAIIDEMKKMQANMVEIQFKMKAAMQEMAAVASGAKVDEAKAIAALQKLTKIENEMKTGHITVMVRIKNALTKEQQDKLRSFR